MKRHARSLRVAAARGAVFAACLAASGCGDESTQFDVHFASDYPRSPPQLSVFGVFKDGRLSAESWDALGKNLSSPFSPGACDIVYSDTLLAHAPDTAAALDDYARANGVTDDLLDVYTPKAKGDLILLITVAGHPPEPLPEGVRGTGSSQSPATAPMRSGRGAGGGRMPGGGMQQSTVPRTDQNVFIMAASLYSVSLHKSVGEVGMTYSGKSVDEAVRNFHDKLATELKGAKCVGWKDDVDVAPDKIRSVGE